MHTYVRARKVCVVRAKKDFCTGRYKEEDLLNKCCYVNTVYLYKLSDLMSNVFP